MHEGQVSFIHWMCFCWFFFERNRYSAILMDGTYLLDVCMLDIYLLVAWESFVKKLLDFILIKFQGYPSNESIMFMGFIICFHPTESSPKFQDCLFHCGEFRMCVTSSSCESIDFLAEKLGGGPLDFNAVSKLLFSSYQNFVWISL